VEFLDLAERFGPWVALVCYVLWTQREKIFALVDRRVRLAERDKEQDLAFDDELRRRILNGDAYSRELVTRILGSLESERIERRTLTRTAIEQAQSAERLASEAVEVMQDFADITRLQGDRQDKRDEKLYELLRATKGVLDALWFVLVKRIQGNNNDYADELLRQAEERISGEHTEGDRG
jgi:hypothetical protein